MKSTRKSAAPKTRKTTAKKTAAPRKLKAAKGEAPPLPTGPVVPPVQQHVATYSAGRRFYTNPDEAYQTSRENAWRMWFDLDIQDPLQSRILATAQLPMYVEPEDKTDPVQVERAAEVQKIVENIPGLLKMKVALLYAIWFGKYGVQLQYEQGRDSTGRKVLSVKDWSPVHGDSIVYKWDKPGQVGVLVGPYQGEGTRELTTEPTDLGNAHVLTPSEREAFVIHTHLHLSSDFYKPLKAGSVTGIGLRDTVYWTWWLKNESMGLLQEYLERVGLGITIYYYEQGNPQSEEAVRTLAESQTANCQIFWPRAPGELQGANGIERIEPSPVGVSNFLEVIREYFGAQLRRMIVGQSMTSEAHTSGMGSGLAEVHENTFMRLVTLDSVNLQETLTRELVAVIHRYSYPEDTFKLKVRIAVDRPDPEKYLAAADKFYQMGGALDEDEVRAVLGFTKPAPDADVLVKPQEGTDLQGANPIGPDGGQPGGTAGPPSDDETADSLAGLVADIYSAFGVEQPQVDRDGILAKLREVQGTAGQKVTAARKGGRRKYRLTAPPWPGAVFDENKHRWVSGNQDQGGQAGGQQGGGAAGAQQGNEPSDEEVWKEIAPGLEQEHPELAEPEVQREVIGRFAKVKNAVFSFLYSANPYLIRAAEEVFDTPQDFQKFGFAPSVSGVAAPQTDPFKAATGGLIGTHLAVSLASKVLAAGLTAIKGKGKQKAA
jgi:hypothetical protein